MRIKRLDVLRCVAVFLVLLSHSELPLRITGFGYVGVDLFFVLSGFLISGLLFTEYKKHCSIDFWRFLVRRSLKIYPSYYLLVLASFLYQARYHQLASARRYLGEIFYLQNYILPLWGHEWSLAVEEHFYILLPIVLLLLMRWSSRRSNPFQAIPWIFAFVAIACLIFRIESVSRFSTAELQVWNTFGLIFKPTQNRIDALFFGVLLGYFQHFRYESLHGLFQRKRDVVSLALLGLLLISPALYVPQRSKLMVTAGVTGVYLGFGVILMLCVHVRGFLPRAIAELCAKFGNVCAAIGIYSYSIYLWHWPIRMWTFAFIQRILHIPLGTWSGFAIYIFATVSFGISMSRLVEYPVLRMRDRLFPSATKEIEPPSQREEAPLVAPGPRQYSETTQN